ncbi:hypothetical protein BpHYR1_005189 [Brachionus plicatilis]|uniref:Uncharacterized protein n=1 Tax=Brachionus plicatilis TaxID=10195 RepID=A0A3M7SUL6_BRAPC|nr:hypothetical protein BpHYR1_005189 [Brachionus plicatilis]
MNYFKLQHCMKFFLQITRSSKNTYICILIEINYTERSGRYIGIKNFLSLVSSALTRAVKAALKSPLFSFKILSALGFVISNS